jgi:hypothetical protein
MIINKSQGQSLKEVGIDLREECFSHGHYMWHALELVPEKIHIYWHLQERQQMMFIKHFCVEFSL